MSSLCSKYTTESRVVSIIGLGTGPEERLLTLADCFKILNMIQTLQLTGDGRSAQSDSVLGIMPSSIVIPFVELFAFIEL